jgi:hypothetical protein
VRGGADDFHAAIESLLIRLGAGERRQKGVVNVEDAGGVLRDEIRGEHAHVFREHQIIRAEWLDEFQQPRLMRLAGQALVADAMKRQVELAHERRQPGMVADDGAHLRIPFPEGVADQDVAQAMMFLGGEHHHALGLYRGEPYAGGGGHRPAHLSLEKLGFHFPVKFRAHEEAACAALHEFLVADHVDPVFQQYAGDGVHQAAPVFTFDEQHAGIHAGMV